MKVLAVDTSTQVCGVAVAGEQGVLAEERIELGLTHAKILMDTVRTVLARCGTHLTQLDGLVVTRGPGSFTGLRIGISTIKGLAAATGLPIVGVSTLAVLAHQAAGDGQWICPMIDARRREVYWSLYRNMDGTLRPAQDERADPAGSVAERAPAGCFFIGNGAQLYHRKIIERAPHPVRFAESADNALKPSVAASLGIGRLMRGEQEVMNDFAPVYLRKSDAEMGRPADAPK